MDIDHILQRDAVIANLRATSKKQLLQELSKAAASTFDLDARQVFETLLDRERLGSTGVGSGLPSPMGRWHRSKACTACLHGWKSRWNSMLSTISQSIWYFCSSHRRGQVPIT